MKGAPAMIFINNKYTSVYYRLINRAKDRLLVENVYTEDHHIIPECFYKNRTRKGQPGWLDGDPNIPENFVALTAREHFICHRLLIKMVAGKAKYKMLEAFSYFSNNTRRKIKFTSRHYAMLKEANAIASSQRNKGNKHYLKRPAASKKVRQLRSDNASNSKWVNDGAQEKFCPDHAYWVENFGFSYGRLQHIITKLSGNPWTEARKKEWSAQLKARPRYQCEYCKKISDIGNFSRWHGEKCKNKGH